MSSKVQYCIIIITLFYSIGFAQSRKFEIGKPFLKYYSPKEYKAGARNWSLAQDNRGVIYVANESCILEFDGNNWRKISVPGNQNVRSVISDKEGKIYVCASTEFGYLEPDSVGELKFTSLLPFLDEKHKEFGEMWDVAVSSDGIFFKTKSEIFRLADNKFTVWDSVNAFRLYNVNGKIYSRNNKVGLMHIEGDELKLMKDGGFFADLGVYNMIPLQNNPKGSILITTTQDGLFIYNNGKFSAFKTEADDFLKENEIYNTTITEAGDFAFATLRGGVAVVNPEGSLVRIINEESGLSSNVCFDVMAGIGGGIWIATEDGIFYCEEPSPFSIFRYSGDLKKMTNDVIRFNGNIYATDQMGILKLNKNSSKFKLLKESETSAYTLTVRENDLIAGTSYGIEVLNNGRLKRYVDNHTMFGLTKSKFFNNRIYAATSYGVVAIEKLNSGSYKNIYQKETSDQAYKVVEDEEGGIWVAGYFPYILYISSKDGKLSLVDDQNIKAEVFGKEDGLPSGNLNLYSISGKILLTTENGLFEFDKSKKAFIRSDFLGRLFKDSTNYISLIEPGYKNNQWILANVKDQTYLGKAVFNGKQYVWSEDSLLNRLDLGTVASFYSDYYDNGEENLWLSTNDGLVVYNTQAKKVISKKHNTLIRKVTISSDSIIYGGAQFPDLYDNIILNYSDNEIAFDFASLSYDNPNSALYQTFLEGYDNGWSDWFKESTKEYTNLSYGSYTFHVKSKNTYGTTGKQSIYRFTILAPWYSTWWAYVIYAIVILGMLYSIRRFELNQKEKNSILKENQLRTEAAEFQAKVAETQSKLIQAENDRKTEELEEARQLQISMLPKELPESPDFEVSVYMKTATEVGGDYYDFSTTDDGSINIALGDATGHGMKAGIMVSMMKLLFIAESHKLSLTEFFDSANQAIKKMSLNKMNMAFGMINIKNNKIQFCNAGIPPFYILRNGKVEELELHGLPLGAMKLAVYKCLDRDFNSGDTIIMMSDGFPELQNSDGIMFGYDKFMDELQNYSNLSSQQIIEKFKELAENWMGNNEPDDDITFVVVKVK